MAKYGSRLGHKQFFTMSILAVSVLGLIVVTGAAMKPTNTQSDAAGTGCRNIPQLTLLNEEGSTDSITYTLRVLNDSKLACKKILLFAFNNNKPTGWEYEWDFNYKGDNPNSRYYNDTAYGQLVSQEKEKIKLKITPPSDILNNEYRLKVKVCGVTMYQKYADEALRCGPDCDPTWKEYKETIFPYDKCSTIGLIYNKTKN